MNEASHQSCQTQSTKPADRMIGESRDSGFSWYSGFKLLIRIRPPPAWTLAKRKKRQVFLRTWDMYGSMDGFLLHREAEGGSRTSLALNGNRSIDGYISLQRNIVLRHLLQLSGDVHEALRQLGARQITHILNQKVERSLWLRLSNT